MDIVELFLAFFTAGLVSFLITPLVIFIYRKYGWLDNPKAKNHPKVIHRYPVPRGGGIIIFVSLLICSLIFLPLDKHLIAILIGGFILAGIGTLDDIFDLNPYLRLLFGLLACLCVVSGGIGIAFISNPFGSVIRLDQPQVPLFLFGKLRHIWVLADLFALLWILGCINFVNWSKGIDGQLPGIVLIAAITIGISSFKYSADITQWPVAVLSFLTAGAFAGFLPFNFYPQKIMPGYGAGALAGFMLAVLSILATAKVGTLFMVLGIPLIDASFVMMQRILKGKSPVWGDAGHLHHKLLKLGWGKRRIAMFYWGVSLVLGILALRLSPQGKLYTIIVLILILGTFFLWDKRFATLLFRPDPDNGSKT